MVIGFIILGLFACIFIAAIVLMIKAFVEDVKKQTEDHEIENTYIRFDKKMWFLNMAALISVAFMLFSTIYIFATVAKAEKRPETEVIETTESTSAPDEIIIPTTEVTIPVETIETTESVETTVPVETTEPTIPEAPSEPVPEETAPVIDPNDLEMLACVIYQEAGGNASCDDCRRYVGDIVLNRVEHPEFPNTIEEVLTAPRQYGTLYITGIKWPDRAKYDVEKEAVARAYRIAEELLSGQHSDLYGNGYIWQAKFVQGTEGFWCCGHFYGR